MVSVQAGDETDGKFLFELYSPGEVSCHLEAAIIYPDRQGHAWLLLNNPTESVQKLEKGIHLGKASEITVVPESPQNSMKVQRVVGEDQQHWHKEKLRTILSEKEMSVPPSENEKLLDLLLQNHQAFAVVDGERGETDLMQFTIDTGDEVPRKQPARRIPFAVREEVNRQLKQMLDNWVIQPSASPIVLVKKKDGTLRFCIDYRSLNSLTKADTFPLPRIDDLLDQLGKAKFFTTLDLAAGYWQIQVHPDSREKTAFITHRGLYEFRVMMPFGLMNAPAAFQQLMQLVLTELNPEGGTDFVNVYIDDVVVFSANLEDHLDHLQRVLTRIGEVGLKLKPVKCHSGKDEVEYLGYLVTQEGLKPTKNHLKAISEFPVPTNIKELQQFVGLTS